MSGSILDKPFRMKYDFYEDSIKKDSILKYITCINDMCLVEDVETKNRAWVSRRNITPIDKSELNNTDYWG